MDIIDVVDVEVEDSLVTVYTEPAALRQVKDALAGQGFETSEAELAMVPTTQLELETKQIAQVLRFLDQLEELEDVVQVWSNVAITDEAAAEIEEAVRGAE